VQTQTAGLRVASRQQGSSTGGGLPSQGSAGHAQGSCRPCAHNWKPAGCNKGVACSFCHICTKHDFQRRRYNNRRSRAQFQAEQGSPDGSSPPAEEEQPCATRRSEDTTSSHTPYVRSDRSYVTGSQSTNSFASLDSYKECDVVASGVSHAEEDQGITWSSERLGVTRFEPEDFEAYHYQRLGVKNTFIHIDDVVPLRQRSFSDPCLFSSRSPESMTRQGCVALATQSTGTIGSKDAG